MRIVRTCPRCWKRLYNLLERRVNSTHSWWYCYCADCGHRWVCRPKKEELE